MFWLLAAAIKCVTPMFLTPFYAPYELKPFPCETVGAYVID